MEHQVTHDAQNHCFKVHLEGDEYAVVKYQQEDDVLYITSTRVPDSLQGKGYGKVMMEPCYRLSSSKARRLCRYAAMWITI